MERLKKAAMATLGLVVMVLAVFTWQATAGDHNFQWILVLGFCSGAVLFWAYAWTFIDWDSQE